MKGSADAYSPTDPVVVVMVIPGYALNDDALRPPRTGAAGGYGGGGGEGVGSATGA